MTSGELQESSEESREAHWIPLSDLMTGLMVMFLLIAVLYMMRVEAESNSVKQVAIAYSEIRDQLFEELSQEFASDLPKWRAQLIKSELTVRFTEPEILFANGSSELKPEFQAILADFFPRYIRILTSPKYRNAIQEVRIEGHTSSSWDNVSNRDEAYFHNMMLSQARTRSTLINVLALPEVAAEADWLKKYVTANGLSSSRLILDESGNEDAARSRRVEFRLRTDAETRLAKILEVAQ